MRTNAILLESLTWEVRRAFRELAAAADRELEPLGLSARDRALLELLAKESRPISISDLARKRSVSRQHIHQSLRGLSDPAWIDEVADPGDQRAVSLTLSRKGRSFWRRVRGKDRAFFDRLASTFEEADLQTAIRTLQSLRTAIQQETQP